MKITKTLFGAAFLVCGIGASGQQALWGVPEIVSPQINQDKTVTFRFVAPSARSVAVTGDFLPTQKIQTPYGEFDAPGTAPLTRGADGIWEYTTSGTLAPEL